MNKRKLSVKFLSLFLAIAVFAAGLPVALAAPKKDFTIATTADMHYYPECLAGNKGEALYTYLDGSNAVYDDMDAMMEAAFESLKYEVEHNGVNVIMLVGDLTTNGEYEGHVELAKMLKKFEEETGASVYVTNGNHDINNPDASSFINDKKEPARKTTPQEFVEIYKDFGFGEAYHQYKDFYDGTQGALTYSIKLEDAGYRLLVADGGKYTADGTESGLALKETGGAFSRPQVEWLKAEAADAIKDGETPLLFTHWNMSGINYMHEKVLQGFVIDDGYMLQEELADAGIHFAFSGHQHVTDLDVTHSDAGEPMYSIITPSLTQFPFAYRTTTYRENADGGLEVTFDQKDIDEYSQVKSYPKPYADIGFGKLYGGLGGYKPDAAKYAMQLIKKGLGKHIMGIRAEGSLINYIEKEMNISIEDKVDDLIYGGLTINGTHIITGKNAMSFLRDIDHQLMEKYFYNLPLLYGTIEKAVQQIAALPVSEVPCSKFIDKYSFGDASKPGTFGDVVLSVMAYFYGGNEDISDDAFMQDFLSFCKTPEFTDFIIKALRENIIEDAVIDNIFDNINIHLDSFAIEGEEIEQSGVPGYIQMFIELVVAIVGSDIFEAKNMNQLTAAIDRIVTALDKRLTIKNLADAVLNTGLINYGSNVNEVLDFVINKYVTDDMREAIAWQAHEVIGGMVADDEPDFGPDVKYTYAGPEKVIPTKEDKQLPVNITLAPGKDASDSFTATWFTKYSVKGSDIEIMKKGAGEFTGNKTTGKSIKSTSEEAVYTFSGFDAGTFGILPWTENVIKHTVTVSGLTPETEYVFRIGDAEKGFWREGSVKTAPMNNGKFTFLHVGNTNGVTPEHYENLSKTLDSAKKEFPDASLIVHSGSLTTNSKNDRQWSWALDTASEHFSSMPLIYASGTADANYEDTVNKHLTIPSMPVQHTENGIYYSYDYSNVHFIVLNTNYLNEEGALNIQQIKWLKDDLKQNSKLWNVVVMNKSIYGASDNSVIKDQLLKLMEDYKIDIILQGSENVYVRTKLLYNDKPLDIPYETKLIELDGRRYTTYIDSRGTISVISGTTGHRFPDKAPENSNFQDSEAYGKNMFSAITVDNEVLALGAYTVEEDGSLTRVDEFAIQKKRTEVKLGDADRDGKLTAADARLALRYSTGLETALRPIQRFAMDVDFSRSITASDARDILRASTDIQTLDPAYIYVYDNEIDHIDF